MDPESQPDIPKLEPTEADAPPRLNLARGMCIYHPNLAAAYACRHCGGAVCAMCAVAQQGGSWLCVNCAQSVPGAMPAPINISGMKCVQHKTVAAVRVCEICTSPMCPTCDFLVPGGLHLCPKCVVSPPNRMSGGRRATVIAAYVFAGLSIIGVCLMFSGALLGRGTDRAGLMLLSIMSIYSAILGNAFGMSSIEKRLPNPGIVWGAAILNGVILSIMIILIIWGNLRQLG